MEIGTDPVPTTDILIVDDMLPNVRLLTGMLTHEGYGVRVASNGSDALEAVRKKTPDLILLDVRMPGMDGYEVCRRLKADEQSAGVPVIFVSALDDQSDKIQGFTAGGIDYITKPFHMREVLARVDTHLTLRRLQRRLEIQNAHLQQEIIERTRVEQALQQVNEELERRVEERTAELAEANRELNAELRERRRAETEREALLDQVREIMNTVPEGLLLLDSDQHVVLANPVARKHLQTLGGSSPGERLKQLGNRPLASILTSPPGGLFHEIVWGPGTFEIYARPVASGDNDQRWVMLIRNVTREREIQRRLQQQDRLAAIGQMAAGIAHDFNNILAVILLYAEMALNTADLQPRLLERLQTIAQQARRASDLIEQILDFSRRSTLERRPMDFLSFLKEQVKLLERTLPENIQITLNNGPGEYVVEADPTRMQQMIMNLAVNARDAMPSGGHLKIKLGCAAEDEPIGCITCGRVDGGQWLELTVSDTGNGIDTKDLPYIFEPFFTTKEPGRGTGLGLAQVYGIVKSHDGHLTVASNIEQGTTFSLYLPIQAVEGDHLHDNDPIQLIQGQGQVIMLVEDENTTRTALAEGLMLINYRVIQAANGREALEYLHQYPDSVNLILSDVVMPEMGGLVLLQSLRQEANPLPVVFMTGHPLPSEAEQANNREEIIWLQKPVHLRQLSQVISQMLTGV